MREKLTDQIKRGFGATYGSSELKELRQEIIQNALDRYDDVLANGADEAEAYRSAVSSIGSMDELLKSMQVPEKKRARGLSIAIPLFALLCAAMIVLAILTRDQTIGVLTACIGLVGSVLVAFGVISLICRTRRKALRIVSIAIGANLLAMALYIALMMILGNTVKQDEYSFDYTQKLGIVSSVEAVTVTSPAQYEDEFEYTVIKSFDTEEWEDVIGSVAKLNYIQPFGDPPTLEAGQLMILIRFEPSDNGVTFVLIGQCCPGLGERAGSRVKINTFPYWCASSTAWDDLRNEYGF